MDMCSWKVGTTDAIVSPLEPCFVRAATDNDVGGNGGTSHAARWLHMGLDRLSTEECIVDTQETSGGGATVQVSHPHHVHIGPSVGAL